MAIHRKFFIHALVFAACVLLAGGASATEVTMKNDSMTGGGNVAIVWGFAAGEKAAAWLTAPCDGNQEPGR